MTQQLIDYFIANRDKFNKYLKERGGFKVGDWIYYKTSPLLVTVAKRTIGGKNHHYIILMDDKDYMVTIYDDSPYWLDLIWLPSTDDLEKIIMEKEKYDLSKFIYALDTNVRLFSRIEKNKSGFRRWSGYDSLRGALAHWVVELEEK